MKIFGKEYNWGIKRRKAMPPINPQKVQEKLNELNQSLKTPLWFPSDGLRALLGMTIENSNQIKFDLNNGIPLKVFFNSSTGEIRLYDARLFI